MAIMSATIIAVIQTWILYNEYGNSGSQLDVNGHASSHLGHFFRSRIQMDPSSANLRLHTRRSVQGNKGRDHLALCLLTKIRLNQGARNHQFAQSVQRQIYRFRQSLGFLGGKQAAQSGFEASEITHMIFPSRNST